MTYVLLTDGAFLAVVGIRHSWPPTDGAATLVGPIVTLVTDTHQSARAHVRITHYTLSITYTYRAIGYQ